MQCTTGSDGVAQAVRSHYEALGELYRAAWGVSLHFAVFHADEDRSQAVTAMERMLADEAGMRQGDSVLDVGCGTGGPAIAVAAHSGVHVTGIDLVPGHVERARVRAAEHRLEDRTEFVEGDATEMPFPDASFDHVYAIESAYHAADKPRFYAECARVLRPGGSFVGTDWLRGAASNGDHAAVLERLYEQFAIPSLIDLTTLRRHLVTAGLVPDVVEDLSNLGNVERNWDALELTIWPRLARAARNAPPNALRTFAEGAETISEAAASGAFVLGHWRARRAAPEGSLASDRRFSRTGQ
jgi:ubiquinone/menaquinone biosynthesis C-methylase UbiE